MADIWFKRCPQCRDYMKKSDPLAAAVCCSCGWKEYVVSTFYCEVANKYCTFLYQENREEVELSPLSQTTNGLP